MDNREAKVEVEAVALRGPYVELNKLLKFVGLASSGGDARRRIEEGQVIVDGEVERRVRRKLRAGNLVVSAGRQLRIEGGDE